MSAEMVLQNVVSYSLQLAVLVGAGAALAAVLRLEAPRWALAYWQALLVAALALPCVQPWRHAEWIPAGGWTGDLTSLSAVVPGGEDLDWPRLAVALLLAGVVLRLVRLGLGLRALRGYRLRSRLLPDPTWRDVVVRALDVDPRLYLSPDVAAPATYGLFRPVVLLPRSFETLPVEQRRALVLHEALHARRRHWLLVLVEEVVRAVLWFHPALGWLVARIRLCREQTVDQDVVRSTGSRRAYLETLVAMARAAPARPVPAPLFLKPSHLKRRIELLLKEVAMSTGRACLTLTVGPAVLILTGSLAVAAFPFEGPPHAVPGVAAGGVAGEVNAGDPGGGGDEPSAEGGAALDEDDRAKKGRKPKPPKDAKKGGVEGGVEGGVVGGVPGGVPGGVQGGVAGRPDEDAAAEADDPAKKKKNVKSPELLYKVPPVYPERAKKEGIEGVVVLSVRIEKSGEVSQVRAVRGEGPLAEAAVAAVQQWRYAPLELGPAETEVTIHFKLDKKAPGKAGPSPSPL